MGNETRTHPETGETLRRDVRPMTVAYAIYSKVLNVPGWYPDEDNRAAKGPRMVDLGQFGS